MKHARVAASAVAMAVLAWVVLPGGLLPQGLSYELKSLAYKRFIAAASSGDLDAVRFAVMMGLDPNERLANPPLLAAACAGRLEVVRYLLSSGANPHVTGKDGGGSPLECAQRERNQALVELLTR